MSYTVAYTSTFYSVANVKWRIDILTNGSNTAETIDLDYDRPISIEWVDTKKTDAIQPALLTVRAINTRDRQFVKLLGDWLAKAEVYRNDRLFWTGMIDNAIFEEPYSYAANYVTEISFSDFGPLKRWDFMLEGVQSIHDIIVHCIDKVGLADILTSPMISLQVKGVQASLGNMFVNTDIFRGDDDELPKCYDVLEQTLQPFGIRIVQNENRVLLYDIERLENTGTPTQIVWNGTDAVMGGSECYGRVSVELSPEANEKILDGNLEDVESYWLEQYRFYSLYYENGVAGVGFYIGFGPSYGSQRIVIINFSEGWFFRTQGMLDSTNDVGIARRVYCRDTRTSQLADRLNTSTPLLVSQLDWLFRTDSQYIPIIPDAGKFQIRVNLDIIFSILLDPFGGEQNTRDNVSMNSWNQIYALYVPVKIELLNSSGMVIYHYKNAIAVEGHVFTIDEHDRGWQTGPAEWGDMVLTYYKYGMDETPLNDGWVTNKHTPYYGDGHLVLGMEHRTDGEYIHMPPAAGILRLTVSNGVDEIQLIPRLDTYDSHIAWQLYRNPSMTVVRNTNGKDEINNKKVINSDWFSQFLDKFSTSPKIGTYHKGMAPSSLCLIFDQYGNVYEKFTKGERTDSLEALRRNDITRQYESVHISLDGTAKITTSLGPITDASTTGNFLPMMRNMDPRSDTMQIRMEQIRIDTDPHYHFAWSDPVCVLEYEAYEYAWADPICAKVEKTYAEEKDE